MVTNGPNIKLYVRASHYELFNKISSDTTCRHGTNLSGRSTQKLGSRRPPRERSSICHHGRATASVRIFSPVYTQLEFFRAAGQIRPPLPPYERRSTTGQRHQTTSSTASSTGQGDTFLSVYSSEDHQSSDLCDGSRQGTDQSASPAALEPKRAPLKINQDILIYHRKNKE